MKFIFPDSLDLVDPSFDFESEERAVDRVRQRDDLYAHEVFDTPPFDGLLVSKGIVDGIGTGSRYTMAQRHRLMRLGVRRFFRLDEAGRAPLLTVGDCGAFSYVKEPMPPFTPSEVIDFYDTLGFDWGMSVDHVVLAYNEGWDDPLPAVDPVPKEYVVRQRLTLELASDFIREAEKRHVGFEPVGVAQGWSPRSYARAVAELQRMGFRRIALGGLVPLKTRDILTVLKACNDVRRPRLGLHLLGVTRIEHVKRFKSLGVVSFDSTSPLRQAFKDDKDNYYTMDRTYPAIRVPQVEGHIKLRRLISKGVVDPVRARKQEQRCLDVLRKFDSRRARVEDVLDAVIEYSEMCGDEKAGSRGYAEVLHDRPWRHCGCNVCKALGINVVIFRGAERNRRRGFHNVFVFSRRLEEQLGRDPMAPKLGEVNV